MVALKPLSRNTQTGHKRVQLVVRNVAYTMTPTPFSPGPDAFVDVNGHKQFQSSEGLDLIFGWAKL